MKNIFKKYFFTGILAAVPITLTIIILGTILKWMDQILRFIPSAYHPDTYLPFHIPGIGFFFTVILIIVIGFLTRSYLGKKFISISEGLVARIPLVRNIYTGIKQILEAIFSVEKDKFSRVVLLEYPRKGIYSLAFVTSVTNNDIQTITKENMINVFVPTTPNPTSGYFLMVPEKDTFPLKISVESAFKVIISGGIFADPSKKFGSDIEEKSI
ncbi:MAG: DUF502 domain-containing protein [Thermodesulfobacteriota bacterium]|nr:DUF502 domain-containing protein [Thermodesulfobacteriota bacterium]